MISLRKVDSKTAKLREAESRIEVPGVEKKEMLIGKGQNINVLDFHCIA